MGVTTQKENGTFVSYTYDGMPVTVNVPYSSMDDLVGGTDEFYSITVVQADKTLDSQIVADQVVHLLEKRHQCAGEDYFHVQSFQDVLQSMNEMLGMVTAFISFVAGISLLVGGIGVMNIMLVSVTELSLIHILFRVYNLLNVTKIYFLFSKQKPVFSMNFDLQPIRLACSMPM